MYFGYFRSSYAIALTEYPFTMMGLITNTTFTVIPFTFANCTFINDALRTLILWF